MAIASSFPESASTRPASRRRSAAIAIALLAVLFGTSAGSTLAIAGIHAYQSTLSPLVERSGVRCRFTVSCSHYAEVVIARDGLLAGGWKTLKRVARCGPWTPAGTRDDP